MTQTKQESRGGGPAARRDEPHQTHLVSQWELVELVAEGSLSRVYRARPANSSTDRPTAYALKLLRPPWQDDPRAVRLLQREAQAGRSVSHPHLVSILQASVNRPPRFVVMPWLEGSTLRTRQRTGPAMDLPVALWIARQVAQALQALHRAGWMHGDVKPSNVFVSPTGHVTLLDLGFARRCDENGSAVDRCVIGTCNYMAPELITSALRADIRSDIYSLGVVLFELFSDRLPYRGKDLAELAAQHKQATPPNLNRLAPHLPSEVVKLIRQMLAKEPLRRPQTPEELIQQLTRLEITTFSERAWG